MARKISINDIIASKLSPVIRTLGDLGVSLMGSECEVLRITQTTADMMGQTKESLESEVIGNVIVNYPSGDIRMETSISGGSVDTESFDIWDILPITITPKFSDADGYAEKPVSIKEGDIIVHVMFDETGGAIPIIMRVTKTIGKFMTRFLVNRRYEATLYRGSLSTEMKAEIDEYVTQLTFD